MTITRTEGRTEQDTEADTELAALPEDLACYVYGVVPASSPGLPDDVTGVGGAPVELVAHGDIAAAIGVIAVEGARGRRADLVAHSDVLDRLASFGPVVPVHFGSVLPDRLAVVEEVLLPQEARLVGLLEDLTGRSQFNLRATYHESVVLSEIVAEDPEVAALRERTRDLPEDATYGERVRLGELVARAMEAKREFDAQVVLDAVQPYCVSHRVRPAPGTNGVLDVALLVDDDRREAFEDTLEAVAEGVHERMRLRLLGPLAPYDFVED